jgi:hypothetical protein
MKSFKFSRARRLLSPAFSACANSRFRLRRLSHGVIAIRIRHYAENLRLFAGRNGAPQMNRDAEAGALARGWLGIRIPQAETL